MENIFLRDPIETFKGYTMRGQQEEALENLPLAMPMRGVTKQKERKEGRKGESKKKGRKKEREGQTERTGDG